MFVWTSKSDRLVGPSDWCVKITFPQLWKQNKWYLLREKRIFHSNGEVTIAGEAVIERWGFFNLPHLLWHWPTLYNGNLHGPMTLTVVAEHLAVELSQPVFTTLVWLNHYRSLISHMRDERSSLTLPGRSWCY